MSDMLDRDCTAAGGKLITEAAWTAIKKCPAFKAFFEQVMGGKGDRKKIALIATAHRLIRVMGAMLRSGQAYDANYRGSINAAARRA